jgi:hypothetical protein
LPELLPENLEALQIHEVLNVGTEAGLEQEMIQITMPKMTKEKAKLLVMKLALIRKVTSAMKGEAEDGSRN